MSSKIDSLYLFRSILCTEALFFIGIIFFFFFTWRLIKTTVTSLLRSEIKSEKWLFIAVFILAFLLRLLWIYWTQPTPFSDFDVYWTQAQKIYHGQFDFDIIERHPGIMLLYTFFFYGLGNSLWVGWAVNLFFSMLSLIFLFSVSRHYFGRFVGWAALVLMSVLPQSFSYTAIMASEIPAIVMMLMLVWLFTTSEPVRHRWVNQVGIGFVIFVATMIRSSNLLLLPFLLWTEIKPLGIPFSWKQILDAFRRLIPLLTTIVLLLGSWVFHQYLLTGKAKLFYGEEIWMLYTTNYEHNGSMFEPMPFQEDIQRVDDGSLAGRIRSYEVMRDKSRAVIQSDPLKYLQFGFVRLKGILWDSRTGVQWSMDHSKTLKETITHQPKLLRHLAEYSTQFWRVILALACFEFISLMSTVWREQNLEKKRVTIAILVFLILWLMMHYSIAVATDRYQFQILPWVILLAGISLEKLNTVVQKLMAKPRII